MTIERHSQYRFDMTGTRLADGKWAPYLEISVCPDDRVDGQVIFPKQRISEEDEFESEEAAIREARRFAVAHVSDGEF